MASTLALALAALLLVVAAGAAAEGVPVAASCSIKPPPYTSSFADTRSTTVAPGVVIKWFTNHRWNGPGFGETGLLKMAPGTVMGIHRHLDGNETQIAIKGSGEYTFWDKGMPEPVTQVLGPGSVAAHPAGALHKMANTGDEDWEWIVTMPTSFSRFEFFEAWPATPDAAGGAIVDVLPWDLACPPGYELPGEEAAKDEL